MIPKITFEKLPSELMSEYIDSRFAGEKLIIHDIVFDLEKRTASASVDVFTDFQNSYGEGRDNAYHWSAITAYRAVSQLAIGYICTQLQMTKQQVGEVMQISSEMHTVASIRQTQDVPIRVNFPKYIMRGKRVLGELEFDIANKTFYGDMRFAVDL